MTGWKAPHSSGTHFGEESREIQVTFGRNEAPKVLDISGAETSGKCWFLGISGWFSVANHMGFRLIFHQQNMGKLGFQQWLLWQISMISWDFNFDFNDFLWNMVRKLFGISQKSRWFSWNTAWDSRIPYVLKSGMCVTRYFNGTAVVYGHGTSPNIWRKSWGKSSTSMAVGTHLWVRPSEYAGVL